MSPRGDGSESLPVPPGAQAGPGPGAGGGFPSPMQAQPDPRDAHTALMVAQIVQAARQLGNMYPAALEEMRTITNAISRAQQKMVATKPAPEVSAPPV